MPVIINDFEMLVDQPPEPPATAAGDTEAVPAPLKPEDIERLLAFFEERRVRVMAD